MVVGVIVGWLYDYYVCEVECVLYVLICVCWCMGWLKCCCWCEWVCIVVDMDMVIVCVWELCVVYVVVDYCLFGVMDVCDVC